MLTNFFVRLGGLVIAIYFMSAR